MKAKAFEHPHARSSWITIKCGPDGSIRKCLVVETHCGLHKACDEQAIADLSKALLEFIKAQSIDGAEIVPFRR